MYFCYDCGAPLERYNETCGCGGTVDLWALAGSTRPAGARPSRYKGSRSYSGLSQGEARSLMRQRRLWTFTEALEELRRRYVPPD